MKVNSVDLDNLDPENSEFNNAVELIKIGLKRNKDLKICLHKNINE